MAVSYILPIFHADNDNGTPLADGLLYTYESGTTTPAITYQDQAGSIENTNPIVLNGRGEAVIFLQENLLYTFDLRTPLDAGIWTQDDIGGAVGASGSTVWCGEAGGTADALLLSPARPVTSYVPGAAYRFLATADNSGDVTIAVSALSPISLKSNGLEIPPGTILTGNEYVVVYDGSEFQLDNVTLYVPTPETTDDDKRVINIEYLNNNVLPIGALLPAGIPLDWPTPTAPTWAYTRDGSAKSRATDPVLFAALCPTISATLSSGTKNVTVASTVDLYVGMPVEGTGIPTLSTIETITGLTTLTISSNATASGAMTMQLFWHGYGTAGDVTTFGVPDDLGYFDRAVPLASGRQKYSITGTLTNASNSVTAISTTRGLYVGMPISHTEIPPGTTIASIVSATQITMSGTATNSGAFPLIVTGGQIGAAADDQFQGFIVRRTLYRDSSSPGTNVQSGSNGTSDGSMSLTPISDGLNGTPRMGPETHPKFRSYLPIITRGAT